MKELLTVTRPDYEHETVDQYGRRHVPEVPVAEVRGSAKDVSGRDFFEAAAHQLQHTVTFTTRWLDGLDASMLITWNGSAYEIDQINHLGYRRDFVQIKAHRIEPEGV